MSFSEIIRFARVKKGFSQERLAEVLSISRQAVSKWESREDVPGIDEKLYSEGKIKIKNASGTWMTTPDGANVIAFNLLFMLFDEYQIQGKIPLYLTFHS